ncbi:MAG: 23S rRNA (adenine(2503)-C(2))-methyltransferase RlmN [Deltaproteobacteria bacterium]|nr:23S rRNA (adenine(2503)-C(2))-methyltransferase RlmN [Deltaproteobacteria bacterium]
MASIVGTPPVRLRALFQDAGLRPHQARLAVHALATSTWRKGLSWPDALARLGRQARAVAEAVMQAPPGVVVRQVAVAADGTRKLLVALPDGALVESVVIAATDGDRTTLCVSSQVGCGRRCTFCETGRLGLVRNLESSEIAAQLLLARAHWEPVRGARPPIRNVVFMGMGEPLDNLDAVADAVAVMTDPVAGGLSWRHVTVSTVGVAWKLPDFFAKVRANLAVSLNAPDDDRRARWMPINSRCDLASLKAALQQHLPADRDVLVEYIVFDGHNDRDADADLLIRWLGGLPARLNLIVANPGPDRHLRTPTMDRVRALHQRLLAAGIRAMVRHPHGRDIGGACGQLAASATA